MNILYPFNYTNGMYNMKNRICGLWNKKFLSLDVNSALKERLGPKVGQMVEQSNNPTQYTFIILCM